MANHKVADLKLADAGRLRIDWAETRMPVLMALREKGKKDQPLRGMRVAGCLHVTKETAVLIRTIIAAGAEVSWSGCNPLSTNDEVAAALAADGVSIYAWHGLSVEEFYWAIERTLDFKPTLTLDDGYGTGQSSLDGVLRATSVLIAGKTVVTGGFGHCGRGVAERARGLGASVITTEIKATQALKALLEGHRVMPMDEAAKHGDI